MMANFLPMKTRPPTSQEKPLANGATFRFLGVFSVFGLLCLGVIHHDSGQLLVRDQLQLSGFLAMLILFGAGALLLRFSPKWMLGLALCLRMGWFVNEPAFTDDHFRYLHEGQATLNHLAAPYNHPPIEYTDQTEFTWATQVNHPQVTSSYFPLVQFFFALPAGLGSVIGHHFFLLRLLLMGFELGVLLFFWRHCFSESSRPRLSFTMYAFHPLPLLEVYGNSHSDIVGVFLFLIAVFLFRQRTGYRTFFFAAAAHVKPFLLAFVFFLKGPSRSKNILWTFLLFAAMMLPHHFFGAQLLSGFFTYAKNWHAFSIGFGLFDSISGLFLSSPPGWVVRLACGLAWLLSLLLIWRPKIKEPTIINKIYWSMFSFWIFFPTVHPWYLLWLLPLACLERHLFGWFWCAFWLWHYLVLPDYHAGLGWQEPVWPRWILVSCAMGLLAWKQRYQASPSSPPTPKDYAS